MPRPASDYVVAFDAKSGKKLWEKNLGSPLRASPTAAGERVFVVTKEGQVFCLSGSDGAELWTFQGQSERASILVNASPAVDGDTVVVPYPTGDVVALRVSDRPAGLVGVAGAHAHGLFAERHERRGAARHRRRRRLCGGPCRPHGRHLAEDRASGSGR